MNPSIAGQRRTKRPQRTTLFARKPCFESLEERSLLSGNPPLAVDDALTLPNDYSRTIPGLVNEWTFDEQDGSVAHDIVGHNDAALNNYAQGDQSWSAGRVGGALRFGGARYALTGSPITYDRYTISFWSNLQVKEGGNPRLFTPLDSYWILQNNERGKGIGFYSGNWPNAQAPAGPTIDVWELYTITLDRIAKTANVYKNGVKVGSGTVSLAAPVQPWVIGHDEALFLHSESWNGYLDDLRVYNRVLTPQEVSLLAGTLPLEPSVLANDSDPEGDFLSASVVDAPQHGALQFNADGRYTYRPEVGFVGNDRFTYVASDGSSNSNVATVSLLVKGPPTARDDVYTTSLDTPLAVTIADGVLKNDLDGPAPNFGLTVSSTPAHGTLAMQADGSFVYTPAAGFLGTDSFTYSVNNGFWPSNLATVVLRVLGATNTAPIAADDHYALDENGSVSVGKSPVFVASVVLQSTTDVAYDPVSDMLYATVPNGAPVGANSVIPINPNTGAIGTPIPITGGPSRIFISTDGSILYILTDGESGVQMYNLRTQTAGPKFFMPAGRVVSLLSPIPGQPDAVLVTRRYTGFSPPEGGTAVYKNGVLLPNHVGDGLGTGGPGVTTVDDVGAHAYGVDGNQLTIMNLSASGVSGSGGFPGTFLSAPGILRYSRNRVFSTSGGVWSVANGQLLGTFGVNNSFLLDDSTKRFYNMEQYGASKSVDVYDLTTLQKIVSFAVPGFSGGVTNMVRFGKDGLAIRSSDNKIFLIQSDLISGNDRRGIARNDSDAENDFLAVRLVDGPQHGTLQLQVDGTFSYAPNRNYSGVDSFTYRANDGRADSNLATVTFDIKFINQAPVAVDDNYSVGQGAVLTISASQGLVSNDFDVEGSPLVPQIIDAPLHGTLLVNPNGAFQYTPAAGYFGPDSFSYKVSDGALDSNSARVSITVNHVNQAPVAVADSYTANEDQQLSVGAGLGVLANDSDVDSETITAVLVSDVQHGTLVLNPDGSFRYTPSARYVGPDSFSYRASDGQLLSAQTVTVALNVVHANHPPQAVDDSYYLGGSLTMDAAHGLLANDIDVDGDTLTVTLVTPPTSGVLNLNANGSFMYTRAPNDFAPQSFVYRVSDGAGGTSLGRVTLGSPISLRTESVAITSLPGQATEGFFDVYVNLAPGVSLTSAGYEVSIKPEPFGAGIAFVSAEPVSAAHPALFAGQTPIYSLFAGRLQVTDALPAGATPLVDGAGLFRVKFTVAANTVGEFRPQFATAFTNLADANGDELPLGQITGGVISVQPTPGPRVAGVAVGSTAWDPVFKGQFAGGNYFVPAGAGELLPLPWVGLNRVAIQFDQAVDASIASLHVHGVNVANYPMVDFSYDATTFTATWTLDRAVGADKLLLELPASGPAAVRSALGQRLDGEWTTGGAFPSGDSSPGGDFAFRLNVLPGDVDQSNAVTIFDTVKTRNQTFTSVGDAAYSPRFDVDGSASVTIFDTIKVRNLQFTSLPDGERLPGPAPAAPQPLGDSARAPLHGRPIFADKGRGAAQVAAAREAIFRQWADEQRPSPAIEFELPHSRDLVSARASSASLAEWARLMAMQAIRRR